MKPATGWDMFGWGLFGLQAGMGDKDLGVYYHGGVAGLKRGDWILPASVTDSPSRPNSNRNRIYVTAKVHIALFFAGDLTRVVYEVEPAGMLRSNPMPGLGWTAEKARVVRVVRGGITPEEKWRIVSKIGPFQPEQMNPWQIGVALRVLEESCP